MKLPQLVQTQFLSVHDAATVIHKIGLKAVFTGMADYIRADYLRWQDFEKCARVANHSEDGVIELMPISDAKSYAFKYVNGHPKNTINGLPCVMAFGVLADVATGIPEFLSELTLSTALRTAAMSAVAAQELARPDSKSMALIGNGAQSEFQALAFHYLLGIEEIRLFDTDPKATEKLIANLRSTTPAPDGLQQHCGSRARCRHRDHRDRRQDQCRHPDRRSDRTRHAHQWRGRRLPG